MRRFYPLVRKSAITFCRAFHSFCLQSGLRGERSGAPGSAIGYILSVCNLPGSGSAVSLQEGRPPGRSGSWPVALESDIPQPFDVKQSEKIKTELFFGDPRRFCR